ncbi:MAG: phosphotransferase [gamma proteobacterium symbiont of Bathyaustriella thionipta]|nr:phosphotransferase [gamma proteobacterium symbiont of Bathyaustriella thionipta]
MADSRLQQLTDWLSTQTDLAGFRLQTASDDASFRRYFRVQVNGNSFIAMDAPPQKEDSHAFVEVAQRLVSVGIHAPDILQQDLSQGFLLLSDLGEQQYLNVLNEATVDRLYADALAALATLQACAPVKGLPLYDEKMLSSEMQLFTDWLLHKHLQISLAENEQKALDKTFACLSDNALSQPQVFVHRDFHSRNLMLNAQHNPGVLDFQDAVAGPVSYDLVSLLKDCYIDWPLPRVEDWAMGYFELAVQSGILREHQEAGFLPWFHLMGVQRHLKAAGIFARLHHRDGKPGYLKDIPRTLAYIPPLAEKYSQLEFLASLIEQQVLPRLCEK